MKILEQYNIGTVHSVEPVESGLIHSTFKVRTEQGQYIIQKLHPLLATKEIASDIFAVTEFLNQKKFLAPQIVLSKTGDVLAQDDDEVWRMQTFLKGETHNVIDDPEMLFEAGRIFGQFHRTMNDFPSQLKSTFVLHKTREVYEKFLDVLSSNALPPESRALLPELVEGAKEEVEFIKTELPNYFLPDDLPQRIIHGDPKVSNILFEHEKAKALIDLDTCAHHTVLVELGDAFRSWCGNEEDDPNNTFSIDKFHAAWSGYKEGVGDLLTDRELELVPKAIGTITLELACRFLTDYFEDSYFGFDESRYKSRRAHNLARVRGQLAEFRDYQDKIHQIV